MRLETVKCPHCGYIYRIDIDKVVEDGETIAIKGYNITGKTKLQKSKYIDLKCPNCNKKFEPQVG